MSAEDATEAEKLELVMNNHEGKDERLETGILQNRKLSEEDVVIEATPPKKLLYNISEHPPIHLTLFFGFQVCPQIKMHDVWMIINTTFYFMVTVYEFGVNTNNRLLLRCLYHFST